MEKVAASKCLMFDQKWPIKIILKRQRNDQKPAKLQSMEIITGNSQQ